MEDDLLKHLYDIKEPTVSRSTPHPKVSSR
jgi:hypothetical protein